MVAAAEGGRWRRRWCWCRSWWVTETASACTGESARSRGRRAAQARAAGTRASLGRGGQSGLRGRLPFPPLVGARERRTARCPPPPGSLLPALPFPVHPPLTPPAAALTARRTRGLWRTRTLGLPRGWRLCLVRRTLSLERENWLAAGVAKRLDAGCCVPRSAAPFLSVVPGVMSSPKVLGRFPFG